MPLLLVPYTLGSEMNTVGTSPAGGAAYYTRRKRFVAYILTSLLVVLLA